MHHGDIIANAQAIVILPLTTITIRILHLNIALQFLSYELIEKHDKMKHYWDLEWNNKTNNYIKDIFVKSKLELVFITIPWCWFYFPLLLKVTEWEKGHFYPSSMAFQWRKGAWIFTKSLQYFHDLSSSKTLCEMHSCTTLAERDPCL